MAWLSVWDASLSLPGEVLGDKFEGLCLLEVQLDELDEVTGATEVWLSLPIAAPATRVTINDSRRRHLQSQLYNYVIDCNKRAPICGMAEELNCLVVLEI